MCGRFVGSFSVERLLRELAEAAGSHDLSTDGFTDETAYESRPNFNLAPTQHALVLRAQEGRLTADSMFWGLVPTWAKDTTRASSMINARSETLTEKPSFRGLVARHRCIVPIDGFYEWDRSDLKNRVPYFCHRADGKLMLVAGLWSRSPALPGESTFTMITRESSLDISRIHDRSPAHLESESAMEWLTADVPPLHLLQADHQPRLTAFRVDTRVNSVRNNDPTLIDEVQNTDQALPPDQPTLF